MIPLEEVQSDIRTKELTKMKELKVDNYGKSLNSLRGIIESMVK